MLCTEKIQLLAFYTMQQVLFFKKCQSYISNNKLNSLKQGLDTYAEKNHLTQRSFTNCSNYITPLNGILFYESALLAKPRMDTSEKLTCETLLKIILYSSGSQTGRRENI